MSKGKLTAMKNTEGDSGWNQPNQNSEEALKKAVEEQWIEYRGVKDRVFDWLKKNAAMEGDYTHINVMLDSESKKLPF